MQKETEWFQVQFPYDPEKYDKIQVWLKDNITNPYMPGPPTIRPQNNTTIFYPKPSRLITAEDLMLARSFKDRDDAILFKLTWA
jgi:hypothetical protein